MRIPCAGLTALLFFAAPMGCTGTDGVVDTDDTDTTTDDTGDPADYVEVDVVINWAIDGVVREDPVGVCLHEAEGEIGHEATLATAVTTGEVIVVNVLKAGETARAWIGPATADLSSDGYRILEYAYDGWDRQWVHPLADFTVSPEGCDETSMNMVDTDGCSPTVNVNGYFPYALHHCTMDSYWYDDSQPDFKGDYSYSSEGDHWLEVTNGQDIIDDENSNGMEEFLAIDCTLQSFGSTFAVNCPDDTQWTVDSSWNGDGFTIIAVASDAFVNELTCTVQ